MTLFVSGFAFGAGVVALLAFVCGCLTAGSDTDRVYLEQRPSR